MAGQTYARAVNRAGTAEFTRTGTSGPRRTAMPVSPIPSKPGRLRPMVASLLTAGLAFTLAACDGADQPLAPATEGLGADEVVARTPPSAANELAGPGNDLAA